MPSDSSTIALIGATPLAQQIATRALRTGINVIIDDVSDGRLRSISITLRDVVGAQHCSAPGPQDQSDSPQSGFSSSTIPTLHLTQSIDHAIRSADFLIDTLPDDLEVKLELFTLFDKFAKPNAIFITTGTIPIDDLAGITFCPDRCIAMRFANPPDGAGADDAKPSVQLIPGTQTSPQTLATCSNFLRHLAFRTN